MINFVKYRKISFAFSGILILGCLICLIVFGLEPGIDFTGGSILELEFKEARPSNQQIQEKLNVFDLGEIVLQPIGEKGILLRMKEISEDTHQEIILKLKELGELEEKRFESIGPVIGKELREKTKIVIILAILSMVLYIAIAFGKITRPIKSWQCALITLFLLFFNVLILLGTFSVLGKLYGVQLTIPVIIAILTVIGYSINDVVVVFDRIRENLFKSKTISFEEIINSAINQTLSRQINTSLTTLFPLIFIFFLGGETLRYFALSLILGIIIGTSSSIFLAGSILIEWVKRKRV